MLKQIKYTKKIILKTNKIKESIIEKFNIGIIDKKLVHVIDDVL